MTLSHIIIITIMYMVGYVIIMYVNVVDHEYHPHHHHHQRHHHRYL